MNVAEGIRSNPVSSQTLGEWGRAVGASGKTLTRLFVSEFGLTFSDWRQRARLMAAMTGLAIGEPIGSVARDTGYATSSAVIAVFRNHFGTTPTTYVANAAAPASV